MRSILSREKKLHFEFEMHLLFCTNRTGTDHTKPLFIYLFTTFITTYSHESYLLYFYTFCDFPLDGKKEQVKWK